MRHWTRGIRPTHQYQLRNLAKPSGGTTLRPNFWQCSAYSQYVRSDNWCYQVVDKNSEIHTSPTITGKDSPALVLQSIKVKPFTMTNKSHFSKQARYALFL